MLRTAVSFVALLAVAAAQQYSSVCVLTPTVHSPNPLNGTVVFTQRTDGDLDVAVAVDGLAAGTHGWHVHTYGDISTDDGLSPHGHFIGICDECRSAGNPQEVGLLDDGKLLTATDGVTTTYSYIETVAKLGGINSIVGRSVVIHGDGTPTGSGTRVAQCVIGRATVPVTDSRALERPDVTYATCKLVSTTLSPTTVSGVVTFTKSTNTIVGGHWVSYSVSGLPVGAHGFHVHTWGDIRSPVASATGGHYAFCDNCRPGSTEQSIGYLFDGSGMPADASGNAVDSKFDGVISLSGIDSIIGRSLVVHGTGVAGGSGTRIAQCVIGEAFFNASSTPQDCIYSTWTSWTPVAGESKETRSRTITTPAARGGRPCVDLSETRPVGVNSAVCELEATSNNRVPVYGRLEFIELPNGNISVTLNAEGVANGPHTFHVHTYGDISDPTGSSVAGHFIGQCDNCRPSARLQEVGNLNNGNPVIASNRKITDFTFEDPVIKLSGINSIIGRAVIIHGDGVVNGTRVAQCVIGRVSIMSGAQPLARPTTTQATCRLRSTYNSVSDSFGVVNFTQATGGSGVWVSYDVSGLSLSPTELHGFHVHELGDVRSTDGSAVAGHFIGNCTACRPTGLQEVGNLFDGAGLTATPPDGRATGMTRDHVIQLSTHHLNNIVGRSLIIHGTPVDSGLRAFQCVIGESPVAPAVPCAYSIWSRLGACVCGQTSFSRTVVSQPRNGGTVCGNLTQVANCGARTNTDATLLSVILDLPDLTATEFSNVATAEATRDAIASAVSVVSEHVVNLEVVPSTGGCDARRLLLGEMHRRELMGTGVTMSFDVVTADPESTKSVAESAFETDSTAFRNALGAAVGVTPSSVTLTSAAPVYPGDGSSGLSGGQKAGIAVGCVLFALVVVGVAMYYMNQDKPDKHQRKQEQPLTSSSDGFDLKITENVRRTPSGTYDVVNPLNPPPKPGATAQEASHTATTERANSLREVQL